MESTKTNQAKELNTFVQTYLAPSKIHGVGVFALQDIPKGRQLFADMVTKVYTLPYKEFDKLFPEVRDQILGQFPQVVNGSNFLYPTTRIQAYMNHSDDPNYDAVNDVALRDIKKDEEITEDYKKIENYDKVFPFLT